VTLVVAGVGSGCGHAPYRGQAGADRYHAYLAQQTEALSLRAMHTDTAIAPTAEYRVVSEAPRSSAQLKDIVAISSEVEPSARTPEISVNAKKAKAWARLAKKAGNAYNVEPALILAMMRIESDFNPNAASKAGAKGLMQLMPPTAVWLAKKMNWGRPDSTDPVFNAFAGAYYLRHLADELGNMQRALAAYNAGPSRVKQWLDERGSLPESVDAYVRRILDLRDHYLAISAI